VATITTTMNGYSLISVPLTTITAGGRSTQVRSGPVAVVLAHVARRFHAEVESLVTFHGWRSVATNAAVGGHPRSNHPSGTAFDANGFAHPYRAPVNFTAAQVAAIRRILAEVAPVVRWGGDFGAALRDGMHFEIVGTAAQVAVVAARLTPAPAPAQEDDMQESDFTRINTIVLNLWREQEMANILQAAAQRAVTEAAGAAVWDHRLAKADETPVGASAWLVDTRIIVAQLPAMVVAALPPGGTGGASLAQVEAAVKLVLAKLTGTLTLKSV